MAKPIVVLKIDGHMPLGAPDSTIITDYAKYSRRFDEKFPDYHVFCVPTFKDDQQEPIILEVFYDKDFTQIQYDTLKTMLETEIKSILETKNAN